MLESVGSRVVLDGDLADLAMPETKSFAVR